ncbi:hypothetical protein [Burkholderia glumae]|uniref:hypothetical protein n=1 Tax=Burkholderia glumae TaxID=337 RepID=UPI00039F45C7|nr:hypothetical protein [Burkholderia glumae]
MRPLRKLSLAALTLSLTLGLSGVALAQTPASDPAAAAPASARSKAEKRKQARAQHKAERKAARAKNSAELKKLEDNGYKPAANDPNYPQDLQNAEKRAAGAASSGQ